MTALTSENPRFVQIEIPVRSVHELQNSVATWLKNKALPSDEVNSAAWKERIQEWRSWFITKYAAQKRGVVLTSITVDEFDLRPSFLAAPGPGFLLWEILQSCYDLDKAICGTNEIALSEVTEWQQMKTSQYLMSEKIALRWKEELAKLNNGLCAGKFSQDAFEKRLYGLLKCVQRLDVARICWDEEMNASIPDQFLEAIHDRCIIIDNSFAKLEKALSRP